MSVGILRLGQTWRWCWIVWFQRADLPTDILLKDLTICQVRLIHQFSDLEMLPLRRISGLELEGERVGYSGEGMINSVCHIWQTLMSSLIYALVIGLPRVEPPPRGGGGAHREHAGNGAVFLKLSHRVMTSTWRWEILSPFVWHFVQAFSVFTWLFFIMPLYKANDKCIKGNSNFVYIVGIRLSRAEDF